MKIKINGKNPWFFPLILIFVYGVIYLPYLSRLGIYWDDWQVIFLNLIKSPAEYWDYFMADRPFSIWTYLLTVPVFGVSPLPWQIFTLTMRIAAAWFFAETLTLVWPARRWECRLAALLLLVFPGFTQTSISIAYSQHFISQALFFASLWLMLKAVERDRVRVWMIILACFLSLLQLLTMEYFAASELIRPVLLYFFFWNRDGQMPKVTMRKAVAHWLPFLLPVAVFTVWRFGYYPRLSAENSPTLLHSLLTDPVATLKQFTQFALQDTFSTAFSVWVDAFKPATLDFRTIAQLLLAIAGTAMAAFWFWKVSLDGAEDSRESDRFLSQSMLTGLLLLVLGGLPVWSTNRQALVGLWSDRFTLAPMAGSALLLTGVSAWLTRSRPRMLVMVSVFIAMAAYSQMLTADKYTDNWDIQRSYYWQLKWRAPGLKPNTAIVAPKLPTSYISDYAVGFALNAMYAKEPVSTQVSYWFMIGPRALGDYIKAYEPGLPVKYTLRDLTYSGTTDETLGVSFAAGRDCLRVLDPFYSQAPTRLSDDLGGIERDMLPISNTNRILLDTETPLLRADVFGSEPEHDWCYYYQKVDLARQFQQWDKIPALAAEAESKGLRSKTGMEYLPFIEGYAQTGMADKALETSLTANTLNYGMTPALCSMWRRYEKKEASTGLPAKASEFFDQVSCPN
jgi:hypothetical protein